MRTKNRAKAWARVHWIVFKLKIIAEMCLEGAKLLCIHLSLLFRRNETRSRCFEYMCVVPRSTIMAKVFAWFCTLPQHCKEFCTFVAFDNMRTNAKLFHSIPCHAVRFDWNLVFCSDVGITEYSHGGEDDMMLMYYNTEADSYQPDEDVKVKMSFVLNELKSVVESGRKPERGNAYQKFGHVIDSSWQSQQLQHQQPTKPSKKQTSSRRK